MNLTDPPLKMPVHDPPRLDPWEVYWRELIVHFSPALGPLTAHLDPTKTYSLDGVVIYRR